jgi:hypothetical protein
MGQSIVAWNIPKTESPQVGHPLTLLAAVGLLCLPGRALKDLIGHGDPGHRHDLGAPASFIPQKKIKI